MDCLRKLDELGLGFQSGNEGFAFSAFVLRAEVPVVKEHCRDLLAIEARDQITQARVCDLPVVTRHRVWRTLERSGEHVGDNEGTRLAHHVKSIPDLQVVFPRLWTSAGFHCCFVPVHKLLHVQSVQNVFQFRCRYVQTFAPDLESRYLLFARRGFPQQTEQEMSRVEAWGDFFEEICKVSMDVTAEQLV